MTPIQVKLPSKIPSVNITKIPFRNFVNRSSDSDFARLVFASVNYKRL